MNQVFADTYYYLALLNPKDHAHSRAKLFGVSFHGQVVTSHYVLLEVADALRAPIERRHFPLLYRQLRLDPAATILSASDDWFELGMNLYRRRHDKQWSLTDCISFSMMDKLGLSGALTGDLHFQQAGFTPLLANP